MISSLISGFEASSCIAFASSSALRARTAASAFGSRSGKDSAPVQRLVDHGSANLGPLVRVLGAEDYEVDRNAEIAKGLAESHEFRAAAFQLRLDNEQIQVTVRTALAPGTRAEQDHLGIGSGFVVSAARLESPKGSAGFDHGQSSSSAGSDPK